MAIRLFDHFWQCLANVPGLDVTPKGLTLARSLSGALSNVEPSAT
jgi:hypothetical protein